ncbi:7 transmembrane receptor (rhodopsin family) domain-containing protein [Ditylenchus destructor]|nr:7 transmembrane receptor (rhodopsin family) domain-containing protein [Ditylenchus destructor]
MEPATLLYIICSISIQIFGLGANSFSLFVIFTSPGASTEIFNSMLGNITVANLIFLSANFVGTITIGQEFYLPAFICPIIHYLRNVTFLVPIWVYALVAIERTIDYFHLHYNAVFTKLKVRIYLFVIWTIILVSSLPYLLDYTVESNPGRASICYNPSYHTGFWHKYINVQLIVGTALPLLFAGVAFEFMAFRLALYNMYSRETATTTDSPNVLRGIQVLMEVRKTLMIILAGAVLTILICYLPATYSFTAPFYGIEVPTWMGHVSALLMLISSSFSTFCFVNYSFYYQARSVVVKNQLRRWCSTIFGPFWTCKRTFKNNETTHDAGAIELVQSSCGSQSQIFVVPVESKASPFTVDASTNTDIRMPMYEIFEETSV